MIYCALLNKITSEMMMNKGQKIENTLCERMFVCGFFLYQCVKNNNKILPKTNYMYEWPSNPLFEPMIVVILIVVIV